VAEAHQMGFQRVIIPEKSRKGWTPPAGLEVIGVSTVEEALEVALGGSDQ